MKNQPFIEFTKKNLWSFEQWKNMQITGKTLKTYPLSLTTLFNRAVFSPYTAGIVCIERNKIQFLGTF